MLGSISAEGGEFEAMYFESADSARGSAISNTNMSWTKGINWICGSLQPRADVCHAITQESSSYSGLPRLTTVYTIPIDLSLNLRASRMVVINP